MDWLSLLFYETSLTLSLQKYIFLWNCFLFFCSQGSVIVNFVINFSEEYTEQEIIDLVQTAFDSGLKSPTGDSALLGSYNVQVSSLELNGKIFLYTDFKDGSFHNLEKVRTDPYHMVSNTHFSNVFPASGSNLL